MFGSPLADRSRNQLCGVRMSQPSMRKLANVITDPRLYAAWTVLVVVALAATYFADPYIFGFTSVGLAVVSAGVFIIGISVALLSKTPSSRAKVWILVSVAGAALASVAALVLLRSFGWA